MDASKLKNILADLAGEETISINSKISELIAFITSNQSNDITVTIKEICKQFDISVSNYYSPSNKKILEEIGGLDYFGIEAYNKITLILNQNSYNVQMVIADLQKYLDQRIEFVKLITATNDNLENLNIYNHFHDDDTFEIGILMPSEFTEKKIVTITKELNRWDKVFKTYKELVGESVNDTEINFVSNGSLQFFIDNSPTIAASIAVTIERVVKLYKNIIEIRSAKNKLKSLGISTGEQKAVEKSEKDFFNKEIEKISLDIIKQFAIKSIEDGRLNELKIAIKGHVTYIAKCIDSGLTIEIIPPEISAPVVEKETEESKDDVKKIKENYEKTLKQIEVVQKSMETINTIKETGNDILKFLSSGEENDVQEDE